MIARKTTYNLPTKNAARDAAAFDALVAARPLAPVARYAARESTPPPALSAGALDAARASRRAPSLQLGPQRDV
jgi:hypothetical protein